MHDDHENASRDWLIPDKLWEHIEPLLPPRKPHPLGCHPPLIDERRAMDGAMINAALGGAKGRQESNRLWPDRHQAPRAH